MCTWVKGFLFNKLRKTSLFFFFEGTSYVSLHKHRTQRSTQEQLTPVMLGSGGGVLFQWQRHVLVNIECVSLCHAGEKLRSACTGNRIWIFCSRRKANKIMTITRNWVCLWRTGLNQWEGKQISGRCDANNCKDVGLVGLALCSSLSVQLCATGSRV